MLCLIIEAKFEVEHFLKFKRHKLQIIYKNSNFTNVIYSNLKFELLIYC